MRLLSHLCHAETKGGRDFPTTGQDARLVLTLADGCNFEHG